MIDIDIQISVVLGATQMPIHQLLRMGRGAVIGLDSTEDDNVTILANNVPVAMGRVLLDGEIIKVEVDEILPRSLEFRSSQTAVCFDELPDNAISAVTAEAIQGQDTTDQQPDA